MGTRHWTQSYADIPAEIDADRYASMVDLLDAALERHASRPAFKAFGQTLNYADVDRLSRSFASYAAPSPTRRRRSSWCASCAGAARRCRW